MTSVSTGPHRTDHGRASDRELVARTRAGDGGAYAELWRRHRSAAIGACRLTTASADPEDVVSEAYLVILHAIRRGRGPHGGSFRGYLCATVRNLARRWGASRREIPVEVVPDPPAEDEIVEGQLASLDQRLVREAFAALPERWRLVLRLTEVDGLSATETAARLGIRPNAAAVLAFRAREGLRRAWLQAHVSGAGRSRECAWVLARIGEHSRDGLGKRAAARVDDHLAGCRSCRDTALEVGQVSRHLARLLVPLGLGAGSATAWFAVPTSPAAALAAIALAATAGLGVVSIGGSDATRPDPPLVVTSSIPPDAPSDPDNRPGPLSDPAEVTFLEPLTIPPTPIPDPVRPRGPSAVLDGAETLVGVATGLAGETVEVAGATVRTARDVVVQPVADAVEAMLDAPDEIGFRLGRSIGLPPFD